MTYDYEYTRTLGDGGYDISNKARVDTAGVQIHIATEVEDALSGKVFKFIANGTSAMFCFEEELTTEEEATLDQVVSDHKDNV